MSSIWDQTLAHSQCATDGRSSYATMKECIRKKDIGGLRTIFAHIHDSTVLDDSMYQQLMKTAAKYDSVECFDFFTPYVAEHTIYDALNTAAEHGCLSVVQHIEPMVDDYLKEEALFLAVLCNRTEVVNYLLPLCNVQNQYSKFLAAAACEGHSDLFELLYPLCNPNEALQYLKHKLPNELQTWEILEQRIMHDKLLAVTPQDRSNKRSKI